MKKEQNNLREAAVAAVSASESAKTEIMGLLAKYKNVGNPNDIVYCIIFELEMVHRVLERIHFQNQQMNDMMVARLEKLCNANQEKMLDIVNRQQMTGRSQFRRLIALHRERLLTRLIMICALGCLSIFAGLGVFYFYILVVI
jgi:hypothetical protein